MIQLVTNAAGSCRKTSCSLRGLSAALLAAATLALAPAVHAMKVQQLDRMADQDQIDYITQLEARVRASVTGDQLAKVNEFFKARDTGEGVSGMTTFELDLALMRSAELNLIEGGMKLQGTDVERVLFKTLQRNGIVLPQTFLTAPMSFTPKYPLHQPVSRQVADKWLTQLEAEVARKSGAIPPALLENPKDASWVDKLDFSEPNIVKALFNGNADRLVQLRTQVLTYIAAFNEQFNSGCPQLYDSTITSRAMAQVDARLAAGYLGGLGPFRHGGVSDERMQLERRQIDTDSGGVDGATLYRVAPEKCDSVIVKKIYRTMESYVQPR